jgi:hypothetical protein
MFMDIMQAINSLKNVDSTALLQFLHPILNMLLHLIGSGGETLQVILTIQPGALQVVLDMELTVYVYLSCFNYMFLDISNSHSVMALNNKCYYKCNRTVI